MPVAAESLTTKGRRSRARIIEAASELILAHGADATTLEAIRLAAEVSTSQLYHYFADKRDLIAAVIQAGTEVVVANEWVTGLRSLRDLRAWRDAVVEGARAAGWRTGCPLASFAEQIGDTDPELLELVALGLRRLTAAVAAGLTRMRDSGELRPDADIARLALLIVTAYEGGMLVARAQRDCLPLEVALDAAIDRVAAEAIGSAVPVVSAPAVGAPAEQLGAIGHAQVAAYTSVPGQGHQRAVADIAAAAVRRGRRR
ncbi:TetR/AcrR family transcriptional regulator [Nocardia asteroides]|uniref:TetR/AcrR family transcriptional regulator n=1 Tax=Nocardia asteroides TaxID=1824 RepID=UPI001E606757|nr:TetR/AcrR family transcriptional regulator [Nocardia asteroides]UGT61965.1 TetR/AcrR family transcriptional regulator [Nocardia asteroides]